MRAKGRGTILVTTKQGNKTISEVLFVPGLNQILLSVSQMVNKGYTVAFKDKMCIIHDLNGVLIAKVPMIEKSFSLKLVEVGK